MAGFFDTLFGGGAEKEAADKNRALYSQYGTAGTGFLDNGLASSKGYLDSAYGSLSDLASKYGAGTTTYLDALGVNGADKAKAANSLFTLNPGTQAGITAGLDTINRRRAAGGMLDSGNADQDAQVFGQNLQNQQYNTWLQNLGGLVNPELSATSGAAGVQGSLSNLYQQDATNRVGLQGNVTSGNASANNLQAQGEAAGAKNLLGAGLSVASLAMGGGLGGLGSAFGGTAGSAVNGAFGPTSYGGANGPTPLTGGSMLGRWMS